MLDKIIDKIIISLSDINISTIVLFILFFAFITIRYIVQHWKDFKSVWEYFYEKKKKQDELFEQFQLNCKATEENSKKIIEFMDNRVHDREQSFAIQKELTDAQTRLSESLNTISQKIDNMQKNTDERFLESERRNNKRIRAELKDKISQSYRYYHSVGEINDMELEALEDLIEEYESADGENSFVHSVVQKEMYTWKQVKRT